MTEAKKEFKAASMDDLLDMNLDDLADMPEFLVPPAGAYLATIVGIVKKDINKHPAFEATFRITDVVELADPTDTPPAPGTETSTAFMMDNELGQGSFKEFIKPIAQQLNMSKVSEVVEAAKGLQIMLVTVVRHKKDDKSVKYLGIKAVSFP
jgi:hypothetical protein